MPKDNSHHYAVIVAGGHGTRLWPLSREELPKQIQKFVSDKTLIEETVDRIAGVIDYDHIYISTTKNYADKIQQLLPKINPENIIVEPVKRGTTAAFAYFSATINDRDPEAVIFSLASDHAVPDPLPFQQTMRDTYEYVENNPNVIALVGVTPTEPDTGLGYIKVDQKVQDKPAVYSVEKFVEKPSLSVAKNYVKSGEYYWNAAYYCFKAQILLDAYTEADPDITKYVEAYRQSGNPDDFMKVPEKPQEIEFINTLHFPLILVPGGFTWSDIGNWGSLHDLLAETGGDEKMMVSTSTQHVDIDSTNCLVLSKDDNRLITTVGLNNIIVVDTEDALLIMEKGHNQDIKEALKLIKERGLDQYL
jgi:mannose-1-phosphate guanylyltransferase